MIQRHTLALCGRISSVSNLTAAAAASLSQCLWRGTSQCMWHEDHEQQNQWNEPPPHWQQPPPLQWQSPQPPFPSQHFAPDRPGQYHSQSQWQQQQPLQQQQFFDPPQQWHPHPREPFPAPWQQRPLPQWRGGPDWRPPPPAERQWEHQAPPQLAHQPHQAQRFGHPDSWHPAGSPFRQMSPGRSSHRGRKSASDVAGPAADQERSNVVPWHRPLPPSPSQSGEPTDRIILLFDLNGCACRRSARSFPVNPAIISAGRQAHAMTYKLLALPESKSSEASLSGMQCLYMPDRGFFDGISACTQHSDIPHIKAEVGRRQSDAPWAASSASPEG